MSGTGEGGIDGAVEVFTQHFFGHISDIEEDVHPLPTLCFVAGDGVSVFHLDNVVMRVGFHLFHFARLGRSVVVVFEYGVEQLVIQLLWKGGGVCLHGVTKILDIHFEIVILEAYGNIGETESV